MTILNTTTIDIITGKEYYFTWSIGCWVGIIATIICVIMFALCLINAIKEEEAILYCFSLLILACAAAILFGLVLPHDVTTNINQYEVTVNDTISFKEITSKYDLIEQRGDIYVLREKLPEGVTELKNDG